jgi:hypothetical protein
VQNVLDKVGTKEPVIVGQNVTDNVEEEHWDVVSVAWVDCEQDRVGLGHGHVVGVRLGEGVKDTEPVKDTLKVLDTVPLCVEEGH